ncbi:MAG: 4Fe-4S binding protein [Candidatus Helarchaeota archaeon]|nr:4Fe-4S binding protein [Candidatus Helarchaeota archaeon]
MCEFCMAHSGSTGLPWFKQARMYAREMYHRVRADSQHRKKHGVGLEAQVQGLALQAMEAKSLKPQKYPEIVAQVNKLTRNIHSGQVITLDEAETMIDLASPIAFIACDCRRAKYGYVERDRSRMTCLGLGIGMFRYERLPGRYIAGAEFVSDDEAKEWLREWNKKGLVHTLMTFGLRNGAPYIGGLCNCTFADCLSISWRLDYGIKQLLKGEGVATLDPNKCNGCFQCITKCQFGALTANIRKEQVNIDMSKCFGCGLCVNSCNKQALKLVDRRKFEVLKYDW